VSQPTPQFPLPCLPGRRAASFSWTRRCDRGTATSHELATAGARRACTAARPLTRAAYCWRSSRPWATRRGPGRAHPLAPLGKQRTTGARPRGYRLATAALGRMARTHTEPRCQDAGPRLRARSPPRSDLLFLFCWVKYFADPQPEIK
jgi:hypothetical protein